MQQTHNNIKLLFNIKPDEDGYPPVSVESLWAKPLDNGNYLIDNIPFFVYGIASGYEVISEKKNGDLYFKDVCKANKKSVFRVIIKNDSSLENSMNLFINLGCLTEGNLKHHLIAIEVPETTDIYPVLDLLMDLQEQGILDYEEGVLNHEINYD
ncbi:MAG: hypothetical protein RL344_1490 [Pseudomonadota bacterium]|jgi:hypothetical protein